MQAVQRCQHWLESPAVDSATKAELNALKNNPEEIHDRFYRDLAFGTGGLRGVMGAGTNRMNIYTVRKATQGLANAVIKNGGSERGVAIAFDSRHRSAEFALEAALCLCANGIKVYLFDGPRPTPVLSFTLRRLACIAGIVITASHNPPEYNGYKVYWEDGAQITYPKDKEIIDLVNEVAGFEGAKTMEVSAAEEEGLLSIIGEDADAAYVSVIKNTVLNPEVIAEQGGDLKIVYSPLHGTGGIPVQRVLGELGFKNVYTVQEQEQPDGDFPTVKSPNPEEPAAFDLALALAAKKQADLVLVTDPDADRFGAYVKNGEEYVRLDGNMAGMFICEYILEQRAQKNILPQNGAVITTIVTTKMAKAAAEKYGVRHIETLTGFKYIGEQIKFFERDKSFEYLFGFEESFGCLTGTYARDKDAVSAVMFFCEAAAYCKSRGMGVWERMLQIFEKYGYCKEGLVSLERKGEEGAGQIAALMKKLRENPPEKIGNFEVLKVRDYKKGIVVDRQKKGVEPTGLPESDVLYFDLSQDAWCCVRPSGTEPKIKFYMGVKGDSLNHAEELLEKFKKDTHRIAEQ